MEYGIINQCAEKENSGYLKRTCPAKDLRKRCTGKSAVAFRTGSANIIQTTGAVDEALISNFISADGKYVDYDGLRGSKTFSEYLEFAGQLIDIDLEILLSGKNLAFRKAFFINLYNVMTMHAIIECSREEKLGSRSESVLKFSNFWQRYAYRIGSMVFSLDDIEHGILRGNKAHPTRAKFVQSHFSSEDPRARFSLPSCDPRIHFCLNCGAASCPQIKIHEHEFLDQALEKAAEAFCDENVIFQEAENEIHLSKIFDWYFMDFANNRKGLLLKIGNWMSAERKEILDGLIEKNAQVKFLPYDWKLNTQI